MTSQLQVDAAGIMDSLSDGVYVCDTERRIVFWSKSAERITGWRAADIVGRQCFDEVLCHVDKDGRQLCGEEFCPLHRSIVTGMQNDVPLTVYAQRPDGSRIPTQVSVAPLHDADGQVVGGVETFRDVSKLVADMERAKTIQELSLQSDLPEDPRVSFATHYVPHDIVGGDYYAITKLGDDQYGLMLADVMGHGVPAALYTMHLSSLWQRHRDLLAEPTKFAGAVNAELCALSKGDMSFAAAVCAHIDVATHTVRFVSAGGPPILLMRPTGSHQEVVHPGMALGIMGEHKYEEEWVQVGEGDRLLFFTDGALEVMDAAGEMLEFDGLVNVLKGMGYPEWPLHMATLQEELLKYSNAIRLEDDLTIIEVCFS